ncbi:unnamed protein product [Adineta ricciae]|uniref:Uncharacterized protein n=1 Tax=Adineta ricciae TaxID=249248 RepID=A0A815C244_ADIRI|nr:unnamed protein product [Adineta ricciae]CAF1277444.1 unnamed protein product [Adineta ricciae]
MPSEPDKISSLDQTESNESSLPSSNDNQRVNTTQKYLLIILFLQWFVCSVILGAGIHSVFYDESVNNTHDVQSLMPMLVMTFYYTFGLSVAYTQYRVGLIIFASIGILIFVIVSFFFGYIVLAITALNIGFGTANQIYEVMIFIVLLFTIVATVAILTLKWSFDLAKSIGTYDYSEV